MLRMRPPRIPTDSRGARIEIGCKVAFNLSGDVAIGVVRHITPSCFHIELQHRAAGMEGGHISKVKKAKSIIVLKNGEQ